MIWRTYQSVLRSDVLATTTSLRMPSTSCAYQSGKVSLSPTVISTPYGSTELSRSAAKSRVSRWPARDDQCQLPNSGTIASRSTGDPKSQLRWLGKVIVSRAILTVSVPNRVATDSHTKSKPSDAQTPQAEKLQMKKSSRSRTSCGACDAGSCDAPSLKFK